ncbi:hypothetical protein NHG23_08540 [Aerococcaceae bacterium NML190073]|nr:hypothetical protein [Aerococcaceae bacterium NML190073]
MILKNDYEYVVRDAVGKSLGVFETEGLAHQFILSLGTKSKFSKWGIEQFEFQLPFEVQVERVKKR